MISGLPRNPQVDSLCVIVDATMHFRTETPLESYSSTIKNGAAAPFEIYSRTASVQQARRGVFFVRPEQVVEHQRVRLLALAPQEHQDDDLQLAQRDR